MFQTHRTAFKDQIKEYMELLRKSESMAHGEVERVVQKTSNDTATDVEILNSTLQANVKNLNKKMNKILGQTLK